MRRLRPAPSPRALARWAMLFVAALLASCGGVEGPADAGLEPDVGASDGFTDTLLAEATVGPEGGTLQDLGRQVTVVLPPGALGAPTQLKLLARAASASDPGAGDPWLVPSRRFLVEPAGLALAQPAAISIAMPAGEAPFKANSHDLGIYLRAPAGWTAIELQAPSAPLTQYPSELQAAGRFDRLGEIAARLHPPYEQPPRLVQLGLHAAYSTPEGGPTVALPAGGLQAIWGRNFGWDASKVEVEIGGTKVAPVDTANSRIEFPLAVEQPERETTLDLTVRVAGAASNTLKVRIAGLSSGKPVLAAVEPAGGAPRGTRVMVQGQWYGSATTRRLYLGGTQVACEFDDWGQAWFVVPDAAPLGAAELSADDGLGGPRSDPVPYLVMPSSPPSLAPGMEGDGLWLPPVAPSLAPDAPLHPVDLVLEARDLPPYVSDGSRLEVRFSSAGLDTGWQKVLADDSAQPPCAGLPSGRCVLALPNAFVHALRPGDLLNVAVRTRSRELPASEPVGQAPQLVWRESAPLALTVAGRGVLGATLASYVGPWDKSSWAMCHQGGGPIAVGDLLCLHKGERCWEGVCQSQQEVSAPELWAGKLAWGGAGPADPGLTGRCFPLQRPMTIHLQNHTLGLSCTLEVVAAGGHLSADSVSGVDPGQPLTLGMGGGRLTIPANALPPLPNGAKYTVSALAATSLDPAHQPVQTADPQAATELPTYRIQISPEPRQLLQPIGLDLPVNPASLGKSPSLALIEEETGFALDVGAALDAAKARLSWALPAGKYEAPSATPSPDPTPVALPAGFNTAFRDIGVVYRKDRPGQLDDPQGRIRVEYVADPASQDFCPEAYAEQVFQAAMDAWGTLESWKRPGLPVRIFVRKQVSWIGGSSKGATSSGFLGRPQVTVRNDLGTPDELRYVVAHELGHVFQRSYSTNLTLSWLDEAASEWAAFATVGEAFDLDGLRGDQDAVRVVLSGLPDSWGGVPKDQVYGSAAWILWLAWKKGDPAVVRRLYETLSWSPTHWASAWKTFETATGSTASALMRDFADDFWLQRFPPIDDLSLSADLTAIGVAAALKLTAAGAPPVSLADRPPLSSKRFRLDVSQELLTQLGSGDVVLRASQLDAQAEVSVWREGKLALDPDAPQAVVRLTAAAPIHVLPALDLGTWWLIHNRWATAGTGAGALSVEVPRITSLSPAQARAGAAVLVNGQSFGAAAGKLHVGGQVVAVQSWSASQVKFILPSFPSTQAVTVRVVTAEGAKTNDATLTVLP